MGRGLVAGAGLLLLIVCAPVPTHAQAWNDARARALVAQGTERRARQLADTGLADYTATAHGYLTFLAQLGEGFPDPPKIVKADEIALEVYWRSPNYSKQWIVGRRDTLVLPTDIQYHRDHLGIVQNNFPDIIRLGEGDEVRDVPHPLSASGMAAYDFAVSDSLRIQIPGRTIDVYELKLRPKNQTAAAAVGALYLARDDAQVVRMAFSFTRAALLDRELEDVSIVLENALIEGRFWLPRRQDIEIRRTGSWLEFPARGIIRGRWEVCCYRVNQGVPAELFAGPEIVLAPPARRAAHRWPGGGTILDSLPLDVRAPTSEEVRRVQVEARELVRAAALSRARQTSLAASGLSELVRVSRAEGLALGTGVRRHLGAGLDVDFRGRFGFADHEAKGSVSLGWRRSAGETLRLRALREYRDAGDEQETSGVRNSIAAQEFGSDFSEPFDVRGLQIVTETPRAEWGRARVTVAYEWHDSVRVAARPTLGRYEPTLPALPGHGLRMSIDLEPTPSRLVGFDARTRYQFRTGTLTMHDKRKAGFTRIAGQIRLERPLGSTRIVAGSSYGAVRIQGRIPAQELVFAGGPISGPGYRYHQFASQAIATTRGEWQLPIPFVPIPLGRWGRIPGRASIVPLGSLIHVGQSASFRPEQSGWYPSFGLGLIALFDLLRFDVARGVRGGRWSFNVDVARDFWRIL